MQPVQCAELLIINVQEYTIWKMLMNALKVYVKKIVLEILYGKRKKKLTFLTVFYTSHKSGIKTILTQFINKYPKDIH